MSSPEQHTTIVLEGVTPYFLKEKTKFVAFCPDCSDQGQPALMGQFKTRSDIQSRSSNVVSILKHSEVYKHPIDIVRLGVGLPIIAYIIDYSYRPIN